MVVDMETPISIFSKITSEKEHSFLLESVTGGENVARYSFMGMDPIASFRAKHSVIEIKKGNQMYKRFGDPVTYLKEFMETFAAGNNPDLPCFFGGAVGYLAYDWVRYLELIPNLSVDDLGLPDGMFLVFKTTLIYDHARNTLTLVILTEPGERPHEAYQKAEAEIRMLRQKVAGGTENCDKFDFSRMDALDVPYRSSMTREEYISGVEKIKQYIYAGDTFQTVLSTRLEARVSARPLDVYRCLRTVNPSPYMFFLNFPEFQLVGASPEMLVRVENGIVENRPIAGTRPRGKNTDEDANLAAEMHTDPKERAEHVMLVDLGRNDVGRVARFGTVCVPELMEVERYSHVMHLVSLVRAVLAEERVGIDALMACFPAGTVSGAPKVRAMEIIEELEPTRRGAYAGAVGYLGVNGNIDTCITIRSILLKDGSAYVQAGAGIVADSQPEKEYEESINKGRALMTALRLAEGGLS